MIESAMADSIIGTVGEWEMENGLFPGFYFPIIGRQGSQLTSFSITTSSRDKHLAGQRRGTRLGY
jgi:hypothetical protein